MLSTGFAAMAWHGSSSSLGRDPYDCDFGVGFWGHATGSSAFVVGNLTGSLSCYLCTVKNASESSSGIGHKRDEGHTFDVTPTDSFHRRVYFAALGLDLQLEAGQFEKLTVDPSQRTITASLATAPYQSDWVRDIKISPALVPLRGRLVVDSPGQGEAVGQVPRLAGLQVESAASPGKALPLTRGGYELPTTNGRDGGAKFVLRWSAS